MNILAIDRVGPVEWLTKAIERGVNVEHNRLELEKLNQSFARFGFDTELAIAIEHAIVWHCPGRHGAIFCMTRDVCGFVMAYLRLTYQVWPGHNLWGKLSKQAEAPEDDEFDFEFLPYAGTLWALPLSYHCEHSLVFSGGNLSLAAIGSVRHTIIGLEDICKELEEQSK